MPDQLAFVPEVAAAGFNGSCQHLELLLFEGASKREIHLIEGIPTGRQISIQRFNNAGLEGDHECVMSTHS